MESGTARFSRLEAADRQAQILRVATELFSESNYTAVSMSDVAAAAGVTRALIHRYFPQKSALYRAVVESLAARQPDVLQADTSLPVDQRVDINVSAALDFVAAHREVMAAISQPGTFTDDPQLATVIEAARESLIDTMLTNHLGTTDVPEPVRVLLRGYMGLFQATTMEWLVHHRATRAEVQIILTRTLMLMVSETLPALLAGQSFDTM